MILNKVRKRLFDSEFSFLPMPVASSIKNQFKLPKSLLACGQRLDRVVFCLRPFDFNDFGSKLTKYSVFPNSQFYVKI